MGDDDPKGEWQAWWVARVSAMERLFGPPADTVGHAVVPLDFGPDAGGAADVIYFKQHIQGTLAVTCELIGRDDQVASKLGNYELAICSRTSDPWGGNVISRLANYTLHTSLNPGETMDIASAVPDGANITAFLFLEYGRLKVRGRKAGILLCLGITVEELALCRTGKAKAVEKALMNHGVYPFTDLWRSSVKGSGF
jgi:Suppressor of fused protein (SUFU)